MRFKKVGFTSRQSFGTRHEWSKTAVLSGPVATFVNSINGV